VTPVTLFGRADYTTGVPGAARLRGGHFTRHKVELSRLGGSTAVSASDSASGKGLPWAMSSGISTLSRNGPIASTS